MSSSIEDRAERQRCAESIIAIMDRMFPDGAEAEENHEQKLWDHLAIMSNFKLDIDYPFDVKQMLQRYCQKTRNRWIILRRVSLCAIMAP